MKIKVGTVQSLWRYPVKSMGGELLQQTQIDKHGIVGDRYWAIRDDSKDELSSVRKLPKLLHCKATFLEEPSSGQQGLDIPHVNIRLPDGISFSSQDAFTNTLLSDFLDKPVSLWPLQPRRNWKFYLLKSLNTESSLKRQFSTKHALPNMASISWTKLLELSLFATPLGRFYDMYPLHIMTSNSLQKIQSLTPNSNVQLQRFRPNLYIKSCSQHAGLEEFEWIGGKLYIGKVVLKCRSKTVRCSMPAQAQTDLPKDSHILRALEQHTARHLGINADVIRAGSIKAGDAVYWQPESRFSFSRWLRPFSDRLRNAIIQTTLKLGDRIERRTKTTSRDA